MNRPTYPNFYRHLRSERSPRSKRRVSGPGVVPGAVLPVVRSSFECLEARIAPAAVLSGSTLVISGDDGGVPSDDHFSISIEAGVPGMIQVNQNLLPAQFFATASVTQIFVTGGSGNDTLTVDFSHGNPLGSGISGVELNYDGGVGLNTLSLVNGAATSDIQTAGPQVGQGSIQLTVGSTSSPITYQNLAPVFDSLSGPLTVNATEGSNSISYFVGRNPANNASDPTSAIVAIDNFEPVQFSNKTSLTINGLGGNDTFNLANPFVPTNLTAITINGSSFGGNGGDALIVTGSPDSESFDYQPGPTDTGSLLHSDLTSHVIQPPVNFSGISSLSIDGKSSSNADTLTVHSGIGANHIVYTPGPGADAGTILESSATGANTNTVPLVFKDLGSQGTVTFLNSLVAGARNDSLEIHASSASDTFNVDTNGTVSLNSDIQVLTPGILNLSLVGEGGTDTFNLAVGSPLASISLDGSGSSGLSSAVIAGTPGNDNFGLTFGSQMDTVHGGSTAFNLVGVGSLTINGMGGADTLSVLNIGAPSALHDVVWNANFSSADSLQVTAVGSGENVNYSPIDAQSGTVWAAGGGAVLHFAGLPATAGAFTLNALGLNESVTLHGTEANEAVTIQNGAIQFGLTEAISVVAAGGTAVPLAVDLGGGNDTVLLSGSVPTPSLGGSLTIFDGSGNDAVTVDFSAGNPVAGGGLHIVGGSGLDSLILQNGAETADTYTAGLINITAGGPASISFSGLGQVVDLVPGPLTVNANGANGTIAYGPGVVNPDADGLISINGHGAIEFSNKTTLALNALGANDLILLNNPHAPTGLTGITIDGGSSGEAVVIQAQGAGADVDYAPAGAHGGTVTGADPVAVTLVNIQALSVVGTTLGDSLTVTGSAGDDTFTITPGSLADSGTVAVSAGGNNNLSISFSNLGAGGQVILDGAAGDNSLIYNGTAANNSFVISASGSISLSSGSVHVPVNSLNITSLEVNGLGGNDQFSLQGGNPYVDGISLSGNGQGIVALQAAAGVAEHAVVSGSANAGQGTIQEGASQITYSGIASISYTGSGDDDTLVVQPGVGDDSSIQVVHSNSGGDEVDSASLPVVKFLSVNTFVLDDSGGGSHTVTFALGQLTGADAANYQYIASAHDTLVVQGANATADTITLAKPATGSVAVTDKVGGVTVTETGGLLGQLQVSTAGGVNTIDVNVGANGLIRVPITIAGGTGQNSLVLSGTSAGGVDGEMYIPGATPGAGSLSYTGGGFSMSVNFSHVTAVKDLISSSALIVDGSSGNDAITYTQGNIASDGKVSINGFTAVEFSNKTVLALNGLAGNDVITISNGSIPTGLTSILVNAANPGEAATLNINGTAGADTFTYSPTTATDGSVTVNALPTVTYSDVVQTILNGGAGADTFKVGASTGNVQIIGGAGADTVDFSASSVPVNVNLDKLGVAQRVSSGDELVTFGDSIENFIGTGQNDTIHLQVQPFVRTIDGGGQASTQPGDTLIIDAQQSVVTIQRSSAIDGIVNSPGSGAITFTNVETVQTTDIAGGGGTGSLINSTSFTPSVNYAVGAGPRSVAIGDVNGDGIPDLVVSSQNHSKISVLLGHGDGSFGAPTFFDSGAKNPTSLVLGDFGNGSLDIAIANAHSKNVTILANNGFGAFIFSSAIPVGSAPRDIIAADLTHNGVDDLVVVNTAGHTVSVLLSTGPLSFGAATNYNTGGTQPRQVVAADIDGDGKLDLAVTNAHSNTVGILLGNGTGGFGTATTFKAGPAPLSLVTADFNQDGKADLAFASGLHKTIDVLINTSTPGSPSFITQSQTPYPKGINAQAIAVSDFNSDGIPDLVIAGRATDSIIFLQGEGNGTFLAPISYAVDNIARREPSSIAVGDLNGDGAADIVVADFNTANISVLLRHL